MWKLNGWTIRLLPDLFDFKYSVEKYGYGEKFYTLEAATKYAMEN